MFAKRTCLGILATALLSAHALATAPLLLGQIQLDSAGYTDPDGTFAWTIHGTSTTVFTYCMSTNNQFNPSEKPQIFNIWSIAGADATDIAASGILSNNFHSGLTPLHFLEAAAQAQSFGDGPNGIAAADNAKNALIHQTETLGDASFDSSPYDHFYYLQQANPESYGYAGQPQGLVSFTPPPVPEPASLVVLGLGAVGMLRRRK